MTSKIQNLRNKIKARTLELGIEPAHDSTGHWYRYKDQLYPSVTKKLGIIKDEGLMNWKMNRALEYVQKALAAPQQPPLEQIISEAKLAPQLEFEGAGDIGSAVHAWREAVFKSRIDGKDWEYSFGYTTDDRPEVKASCAAIKRCIADLKAEPLACELRLVDPKILKNGKWVGLGLGGSLDDIWAVPMDDIKIYQGNPGDPLNGGSKIIRRWETWLVDLKTSNIGNKDSYYFQVTLYWHMFKKLYKIKIDKLYILHTSKTRFGEYELIELKHPKRYLAMAKNVLKLYDDLEELKELKKPEVAKI